MARALICTGVLGGGTAVVFAIALVVSVLFPQGSTVPVGWSAGWGRPVFADDLRRGGDVWTNDLVIEQVAPGPSMIEHAIPAPPPAATES